MALTTGQLAEGLKQSAIMSAEEIADLRNRSGMTDDNASAETLAKLLVKQGRLTRFQASLAYSGKAKNLLMGSYVKVAWGRSTKRVTNA